MATSLHFIPSRVEGLPAVKEAVVFSDRLELLADEEWIVVRFDEMARWPRPRWLWRKLAQLGRRPSWLPVADRDWFHSPPERFFRFYTVPPIVVYMPDETGVDDLQTVFRRMQDVIAKGGFSTFDLG